SKVARDHDVGATIERTADRLEGLATHDDRPIDRERAEMGEIGFQPPWKLAFAADDSVLADGGDQHDLHPPPPRGDITVSILIGRRDPARPPRSSGRFAIRP